MEDEIEIEHESIRYSAPYYLSGDTVTVYLPNGEARSTVLRGLDVERAAETHLRSYVLGLARTQQKEQRNG